MNQVVVATIFMVVTLAGKLKLIFSLIKSIVMVLFILSRILFVASMVFLFGYVFGSFSRNRTLTVLTRISLVLTVILFIGTSIFFRISRGRQFAWQDSRHGCHYQQVDSIDSSRNQ